MSIASGLSLILFSNISLSQWFLIVISNLPFIVIFKKLLNFLRSLCVYIEFLLKMDANLSLLLLNLTFLLHYIYAGFEIMKKITVMEIYLSIVSGFICMKLCATISPSQWFFIAISPPDMVVLRFFLLSWNNLEICFLSFWKCYLWHL